MPVFNLTAVARPFTVCRPGVDLHSRTAAAGKIARACRWTLATCGGLTLAAAAYAQTGSMSSADADCQQSNSSERAAGIASECIYVSAKAPEKVSGGALGTRSKLDTPFSITSATAQDIQTSQAKSLQDVFAGDASVARIYGSDYNPWSSSMLIRGVTVDQANGLRVNGQPVDAFGVNLPLEAMEQVQMLKGAAGFMYGFAAPGGIINYVTKKPTETTLLSVDAGYSSDSVFKGHIDAGGRFGPDDRLGYRVNLVQEEGESYTDSHINRNAASVGLDARLTSSLTWTSDLLYQRSKLGHPQPYIGIRTGSYTSASPPPTLDGTDNPGAQQSYNDVAFWSAATGLHWQIAPTWKANLDAGLTSTHTRVAEDYFYFTSAAGDYYDDQFDGLDIWKYKYGQLSIEGTFDTGLLSHQVVAGLSYMQQLVYYNTTPARVDVYTYGLNLLTSVAPDWNPRNTWGLGMYRDSQIRQRAGFLSDTLQIGSHWSVIGGVRYIDYFQQSYSEAGVPATPYAKKYYSPTGAVLFKPIADATVYFSYVEAPQQGAQVANQYVNRNQILSPLVSKQYELGGKWATPDWSGTVAVFQLDRGAGYANSANVYVQDGLQRYRGTEVQADVRAAPGLTLGGSALYLFQADYLRTNVAWLIDRRLAGSTHWNAALKARYDFPTLQGMSVFADGQYWGPMVVSQLTAAQQTLTVPGHTVFNLGASYSRDLFGYGWTFRGELRNVFDREYWQGASNALSIGQPRYGSLSVQVDF